MAINPENVRNITIDAISSLKGKALGGVSKESAQNAISEAVNKAVRLGEEAVGRVQQEMQALRGKTAQEIADITSQKDAFVLQARQDAAKQVEQAQQKAAEAVKQVEQAQQKAAEAVKQAKATKSAEKILPNGHKEVRSVNKNGAVMVKEYNEAGQLLRANVTTLDGSIRRTSYNPVTGEPLKTFTNTSGKYMLIEYKAYGQHKVSQVNNKKVKPQKPTLVSQTRPEYVKSQWSGENGQTFDRIYSDGSKETIKRFTSDSNRQPVRTELERFDANGNRVYDKIDWLDSKSTREHIYKENKIIAKENCNEKGYEYVTYNETVYDPNTNSRVVVKAKLTKDGATTTYKALKDEFGFYTGTYQAKTVYPKGSGKKPEISEVSQNNIPYVY